MKCTLETIKEGQSRLAINRIAHKSAIFLRSEGQITCIAKCADITLRDVQDARLDMQANDILVICNPGTQEVTPDSVKIMLTIGICLVVIDGIYQVIDKEYVCLSGQIAMENIPRKQVDMFLKVRLA